MKKIKNSLPLQGLMASVIFIVFSCSMNPELDRAQAPASPTAVEPGNALAGPGLSFPISMNRVDLFTNVSASLTGTVTVQITNGNGTVLVGSTTVSGNSLLRGGDFKNTFYFPAMTLNSGEKYRINVIRSNPHNYVNDYFYWRSCSVGTNAYPYGVTNFAPTVVDFAFRTFSDGYLDQQQNLRNYGFAVGNTYYAWQEFVPQKIWIIGQ